MRDGRKRKEFSMKKEQKGLSFKKLDLHVHSPASKCFPLECTPEEFVQAAINQGLDGIAITDHNTAEWIDPIIEAAKPTKLVVFPGVEISCTGGKHGIHIICLLDPSKNGHHINDVLSACGIKTDDRGKTDAISEKSPLEIIKEIRRHNGIAMDMALHKRCFM